MDRKCWWCVHDLPTESTIHLPVKYDAKKNVFETIGGVLFMGVCKGVRHGYGNITKR
jgi:hypothetical protein